MSSSLGVGRPPTACRQCKQQKVRCSGNLPRCKRCVHLNLTCLHPNTAQSQGRARSRQRQASLQQPEQFSQPVRPNYEPLNILKSPDYLGIPDTLVSDLVDAFFSHLYNSRLLLHRAKFEEDRQSQRARPHLLFAVCAMGGKFRGAEKDNFSLGDFALTWAERAGKLALNEVDVPHEDNIVTLLILTLFWYMEGAWRKSFIYKGIALQTANLLSLEKNAHGDKTPLESELSRRRFWACYLTNCHVSNSIFLFGSSGRAGSLPLPWRESDFEAGVSGRSPVTLCSGSTNGGIYSELIRAMSYWSAVDTLLKTAGTNHQAHVSTIHQLDAEIREWWSRLPQELCLNPANVATFNRIDLVKLLLVHIVYHQSLCALHASVVPLFTWGSYPTTIALPQQLSAQLAYENACTISRLFKMVLDHNADISDFPSFLGYAAYCSFAVQVPFKWCLDSSVRGTADNNTAVNLRVIHGVSRYWKFIYILSTYAKYLAEVHSQHQIGLDSEPKGLSFDKLRGFRISAAHARASMLSMNGILWKEDGCVAQGEELEDLEFSDENNGHILPQVSEENSSLGVSVGEEEARFTAEDTSATTIYDESPPSVPRPYDFSRCYPPVLFHPFVNTSDILDPATGNLGFADFDVMNAANPSVPLQETGNS